NGTQAFLVLGIHTPNLKVLVVLLRRNRVFTRLLQPLLVGKHHFIVQIRFCGLLVHVLNSAWEKISKLRGRARDGIAPSYSSEMSFLTRAITFGNAELTGSERESPSWNC